MSRPRCVLLPGLLCDGEVLDAQVTALSDEYDPEVRFVVCDLYRAGRRRHSVVPTATLRADRFLARRNRWSSVRNPFPGAHNRSHPRRHQCDRATSGAAGAVAQLAHTSRGRVVRERGKASYRGDARRHQRPHAVAIGRAHGTQSRAHRVRPPVDDAGKQDDLRPDLHRISARTYLAAAASIRCALRDICR